MTGVLKQPLKEDVHGISIAGGKGSKATATKNDIPKLAEKHYNLSSAKIDNLLYASKMAAKLDMTSAKILTEKIFIIRPIEPASFFTLGAYDVGRCSYLPFLLFIIFH